MSSKVIVFENLFQILKNTCHVHWLRFGMEYEWKPINL